MLWYWLVWLVVGFCLPEFVALGTGHPQWTLSDTVWRIFSVQPHQDVWQWKAAHFLLAVFMVWLTGHLVFRIWR